MVNKTKKSDVKNTEHVNNVENDEVTEQKIDNNIIIDPDKYIMKFGKYNGMRASLLAQDVKSRKYLEWLSKTDWLHDIDKKIIGEILSNYTITEA